MTLIRTHGIPHCDRSRIADKCLKLIESAIGEATARRAIATKSSYPSEETNDDEGWDTIPF